MIQSLEEQQKDIAEFITKVKEIYKDLPLFVFSGGMVGVLISVLMNYLKNVKIDGLLIAGGTYKKP